MCFAWSMSVPSDDLAPGFDCLALECTGSCRRGPEIQPSGDDSVIARIPEVWAYLKFTLGHSLSQAVSPNKDVLSVKTVPGGKETTLSPTPPGRVVTCKCDVSSHSQGQREEYLGGCVQPHTRVLEGLHLEGTGGRRALLCHRQATLAQAPAVPERS